MLAKWTQILPIFLYKKLAKKHCEMLSVTDKLQVHKAAKDVLIIAEENK